MKVSRSRPTVSAGVNYKLLALRIKFYTRVRVEHNMVEEEDTLCRHQVKKSVEIPFPTLYYNDRSVDGSYCILAGVHARARLSFIFGPYLVHYC